MLLDIVIRWGLNPPLQHGPNVSLHILSLISKEN